MSATSVPGSRPRGRPRKDANRQLVVAASFGQTSGNLPPFPGSELGELHTEDVECPQMEDEDEAHMAERLQLQKKKEIKRSWREEWKIQHKWVYPIRKDGGEIRLKCHWCTIFNMDNVFAKEGCSTIQLSALNTHAKSEAHKTAESRWDSCDMTLTTLNVPDSLWDLEHAGARNGGNDAGEGEAGDRADEAELNGAGLGRKRKTTPLTKGETLGSIMQKNNSRIVEVLLDAETGRNKRHATDVALAKRHFQLEEQKLRIEEQRLEFEKMRFEGTMALGQGYITALTNIGNGLMKIGNAMEATKKS
ncbi:hypothetical protein O6H91_14G025700 [Diphasiastrum complanatum]|uniref:Uncharacterized protein n=1 Tax=Diphasiastrum complanatum TaxID=34168 RepID=A0ACC2BMG2_DIPCM|nr:hypothetical protein O6H91_14G025700 [Diphasiastrum complanatum]